MNNETDKKIREYFKTFTPVEIGDSTYLFGINFDTAPMEIILDSLIALYQEVKDLRELIDSNFREDSEEKILVPKDQTTQQIVIENYYRKTCVLQKALSNTNVLISLKARIREKQREEESKSIK